MFAPLACRVEAEGTAVRLLGALGRRGSWGLSPGLSGAEAERLSRRGLPSLELTPGSSSPHASQKGPSTSRGALHAGQQDESMEFVLMRTDPAADTTK